jgi:hypothetical protein
MLTVTVKIKGKIILKPFPSKSKEADMAEKVIIYGKAG